MNNGKHIAARLAIIMLTSTLCACIVAPKKVASYDEKCRVSTQKIELTMEQMHLFNDIDCLNKSCEDQFIGALIISTFVTTTSAVLSGSVALVGNTLYWAEKQGKCLNVPHQADASPTIRKEKKSDEYIIEEEIITAKF